MRGLCHNEGYYTETLPFHNDISMDTLTRKIREHVIELSNTTASFIHTRWFVKYHLEIVEQIALELCDRYPAADRDLVTVMVWMHDYGKIIDFDNQSTVTLEKGEEKLREFGFPEDYTEKIIRSIGILEQKLTVDLHADTIPIEVKIVSSADGAAHLVGPFFFLWWHENTTKPFEELMEDNTRKHQKDWERKIVLPEVIEAFRTRHDFLLEHTGTFPEKYLL